MLYGQLMKELPTRLFIMMAGAMRCVFYGFFFFLAHFKNDWAIPLHSDYATMRTPVYAQKVTLFPEFVHFIVFKVYISFFVSSCRVLFILHYNFSVDMVISGCVCVRRPIVLRASEMETVALQLCGANAI